MKTTEQMKPELFSELLFEGFVDDPGILFQMSGVRDKDRLFMTQCKGEIEAFLKLGYITAIQDKGFLIGFTTMQLQQPEFAEAMGHMAKYLLKEADEPALAAFQSNVTELVKITRPDWFIKYVGTQPVYILQVIVVSSQARGTGVCRKLLTPIFEMCAKNKLPIVLQTHNSKNVPLYEHFGFEIMESPHLVNTDMTCYNMMRRF